LKDEEKSNVDNYKIRSFLEVPSTFRESGGSAQSGLAGTKQDAMNDFYDKKLSYQLCPSDHKYTNIQPRRTTILPKWNKDVQKYQTNLPFVGEVERSVLCRTNHSLNYLYGKAPIIEEVGFLFSSKYYIVALLVGLLYFIVPFVFIKLTFLKPFIVKLMEYLFPKSGEGMDREEMNAAHWKQYIFVEEIKGNKKVRVDVNIYGDYGYLNTARLLVEEGIIFAMERKEGVKENKYGFLTPAIAFGENEKLIKRLNNLKQFDIKFKSY